MSPQRIRPGSANQGRTSQPPPPPPSEDDAELVGPEDDADPELNEAVDSGVLETEDTETEAEAEAYDAQDFEPEMLQADEEVAQVDGDVLVAVGAPRRLFRRLYYGETRFDFVRRKRLWFGISALIIVAGAGSLATRGLNLGIDFVGGTSWSVPITKTLTNQQVQNAIGGSLSGETITFLGNHSTNSVTLQVEAKLPKGQSAAATQRLQSTVAVELSRLTNHPLTDGVANAVSIESVGPSWGAQITHKATVALIVFFILIAAYISLFFEWRMAFAAIVAVLHDILVTVGVYSLTGLEVTPDTVVAFLTILGYSLYDTIVVFDRVRDNVKNLSVRDRLTYSDIVNVSMNQTLARSINTSLVAIMPILAVLVLGAEILGATTLQYFGLALLVGLTTGAYSSIFIASPLVALIKEREPRYRIIRERLEQRGGGRVLLSAAAVAANDFDAEFGERRVRSSAQRSPSNQPGADGEPVQPRKAVAPRSARPAARTRRKGRRR